MSGLVFSLCIVFAWLMLVGLGWLWWEAKRAPNDPWEEPTHPPRDADEPYIFYRRTR